MASRTAKGTRTSWSGERALLLGAALLVSAALGCRDRSFSAHDGAEGGAPSGDGSGGLGGNGVGGAIETGDPDVTPTGDLTIDPEGLAATVTGDSLAITVPVQATAGAASGTLTLSLLSVDNTQVLEERELDFEVAAEDSETLRAELPLPAEVETQSDLVRYNVRLSGAEDGLSVTRSLQQVITPYELRVEGPRRVKEGRPASYRVQTRHAVTRQPLADFPVSLSVLRGDESVETLSATSDELGVATFELDGVEAGDYSVSAETGADGTKAAVGDSVQVVAPGDKVLLTTDKPIYQPGQLVYLRALALREGDNTPLADTAAEFEIEDGKGNKIFKETQVTDGYGIAATRFRLGQILNVGTFTTRVTVEGQATEKTVEVSRYALPKFGISVSTDQSFYQPGQTIEGVIDAGYFFGEPVADAEVVIEGYTIDVGETLFGRVQGRTTADGQFRYSIALPTSLVGLPLEQGLALAYLSVTVTDTAGQQVVRQQPVTVAPSAVTLAVVPEAGELVPGLENKLLVFVSSPDGSPVGEATVHVTLPDETELDVVTDAFGQGAFTWDGTGSGAIRAAVDDEPAETFTFAAQGGLEHVLLRTDAAVYEVGQTVNVDIRTSEPSSLVYVDWLNAGQVVEMQTLQATAGEAQFQLPLDTTLLGNNRIEAYVVDADGNIVRASRTIFVRGSGSLSVELRTDKEVYAPGEPAQLTFSVTDEAGEPAAAALGVQIVDEAVYALVDAHPGLLKTYFELEDEFAVPSYEIRPPLGDLEQLLLEDDGALDADAAQAKQDRAAGKLASLGGQSLQGIEKASWADVVSRSKTELSPYVDREREQILESIQDHVPAIKAALSAAGCTYTTYSCGTVYYPEALAQAVAADLSAHDFWGNEYREAASYSGLTLTSDGPDEVEGTNDDISLGFSVYELDEELGSNSGLTGGGAMAAAGGTAAIAPGDPGLVPDSDGTPVTEASDDDAGPRVRSDFPETLYVNPAVITGGDGTATVEVPMADSITEWRVSSLANTQSGKLGGGVAGITVFQDFFVDIDFPATLTRGDEVSFPIAVYNYLDEPQTVTLTLDAADWYTPLGETTQTVELASGEVRGVRFPVRVDTVGVGTLTVRALGTSGSDAVARTVRVEPDGKRIAETYSGSLAAGELTHALTIPDNAVPGSPVMFLNVYPAYLAQVVEGMDSMLQTPTGCFEQTTSSTWPNVLVTDYMTQTGQITPEIQLKAESLISAGYQRLLTYEHPAGGFSWFGTQDPAPYLSVTAFGLMEFADMARVHTVDDAMVERTAQWLIGQQAPDGSWEGDQSEFFTFHTSTVRNTAFVVWSLGSSGHVGAATDAGLSYVASQLSGSEDAYTLAMIANAYAVARPDDPVLDTVFEALDRLKQVDGDLVSWDTGGTQTNFYASGGDGATATTALVTHALLLADRDPTTIEGALQYLTSHKDDLGNFGSTQATVWTLKTLVLAAHRGTESAVGTLAVEVDGAPFSSVELTADQGDVMTTVDLSSRAAVGVHDVRLEFVGTGKVSYNLVGTHHVPWVDVVEPTGPLSVGVAYDKTLLRLDETVTATVTVTNHTDAVQNMVLVTLGMPPGFQVLAEDFDPYLEAGVLAKAEPVGKQLNLYLSELPAASELVLEYRLQATMPVVAADGGASVYPYYQPDQKSTAPATTIEVTE